MPQTSDRLHELFPVPRDLEDFDLDPATERGRSILAIDHSFDFASLTTDEDRRMDEQFRFLHVEMLLDQAADLLDRGIQTRAEYDEAAEKAFNLGIELKEVEELDEIHEEETEAGFYRWWRTQSNKEFESEDAASRSYREARARSDFLFHRLSDPSARRIERQALAGNIPRMEALPFFRDEFFVNADVNDTPRQAQLYTQDSAFAEPGAGQSKSETLRTLAVRHHDISLEELLISLEVELNTLTAQAESSRLRSEGAKAKADFDERDGGDDRDGGEKGFRFRRMEVARALARLRAKVATEENGILNFPEKMRPIKARFDRDFRDAVARLAPAHDGLQKLYGYNVEPPRQNETQFFDKCLIWVRDAISFLVQFSQLDQLYVMPVSVRSLVVQASGEAAWAGGLSTGVLEFNITEDLFPEQRHIRLRGLSVFVRANTDDDVWQAKIDPPNTGRCHHLNSASPQEFDQSFVPPCRVSRAMARTSIRDADVVGVSSLHNASPFGSWRVTLNRTSLSGTPIDRLEDVQLDLYIAMRSMVEPEAINEGAA